MVGNLHFFDRHSTVGPFEILSRSAELTIVRKVFSLTATTLHTNAFGNYWAFIVGHHSQPWASVWANHSWKTASGMVAALFPPFSFARWRILPGDHQIQIYLTAHPLRSQTCGPVGFASNHNRLPEGLESLLSFIAEHENYFVSLREKGVPESIENLKSIVDNSYQEQEHLVGFYRRQGVSYEGLARGFKEHYGLTPSQYRLKLRLLEATTQILCGHSVTEAAFNSGYNNLSLFNRQFLREFDCKPSRLFNHSMVSDFNKSN